jgi:hypothetical protein
MPIVAWPQACIVPLMHMHVGGSVGGTQSLSIPSQMSVTPGWINVLVSLQSLFIATYPAGAEHASTDAAVTP